MLANHEIRRAQTFAKHPSKILLPLFLDKIQTIDTSTLSQYLVSNILHQVNQEGLENVSSSDSSSDSEEPRQLIKVVKKNQELETQIQQVQQIIKFERKSIQHGFSPDIKSHRKMDNQFCQRMCQSAQNLSTLNLSAKKRNKSLLFNSEKHSRNTSIHHQQQSLLEFVREIKFNKLASSQSCYNLSSQSILPPQNQKIVTIIASRIQNSNHSKKPPRNKSKSQPFNNCKSQRQHPVSNTQKEMSQVSTQYKTTQITPEKQRRKELYSQRAHSASLNQNIQQQSKFAKYFNPHQVSQSNNPQVAVVKCFAHL